MKISVVVDNRKSWIVPYAKKLVATLKKRRHDVSFLHGYGRLRKGDIAFFLSCEKIVPRRVRGLHGHNIVLHGSDLPKGKGWSPLTWQVLEGRKRFVMTLFEMDEKVDTGHIYLQETLRFKGHELIDELRDKQGKAIIRLALKFVKGCKTIRGRKQRGAASCYPRRTPADSELDPNKTLAEQFNLLRVVDNERYPAFFKKGGHTYILKIYKEGET